MKILLAVDGSELSNTAVSLVRALTLPADSAIRLITVIGDDHWTDLCARLHIDLADAHEGLRFKVEQAPPGSLPRFELKAKRLVDKRPVAAYQA